MPPVAFPSPTRMSGRKAMNEEQIRVAWDNMPCLELTESSNQHTRSCDSQGLELDANPSKRKSKWGIQCATPWEIRPAQVQLQPCIAPHPSSGSLPSPLLLSCWGVIRFIWPALLARPQPRRTLL